MTEKGIEFECRVARLLSREGLFVRRRVDLDRWVYPAKVQTTDVDLLSFDFGSDLHLRKTIGECKTTQARSAPKEIDRMLWLVGLKALTRSDAALLAVVNRVPVKVREVGRELAVLVQDGYDIERRERQLGIDRNPDWGSHDPALLEIEAEVQATSKKDKELNRIYWFLRSEFWHAPVALATKRVLSAVTLLSQRWKPDVDSDQRRALSWLLADCVVCFSVAATRLASSAITMSTHDFREHTAIRLSEGWASMGEMELISKAVDEYVTGVLQSAGVSPSTIVSAMGAFEPTAPDYSDSLLEVLERLAERAMAARTLPLILDLVAAERIKRRSRQWPAFGRWQIVDPSPTMALARLLLAFLKGHCGLPIEFASLIDDWTDQTKGSMHITSHTSDQDSIQPGAEQLQLEPSDDGS